jgi:O-antigen/teichoic acid export membrane protein
MRLAETPALEITIFKANMFNFNKLASLQIFQLLRYGAFIFIGIGFAKLQLTQTEIGRFETFIMVSGMVSFFWVSGIINSMLAIYPNKSSDEQKTILLSTFLSLGIFSLLAGAFLYLFSQNLLGFLHKQSGNHLIQLSIIYLLLSGPSFIAEYILFLNEKKKAIVIYGVISSVLAIILALIPAAIYSNTGYAMLGLILLSVLKLVFTLMLLQKYATLKPSGSMLMKTVAENLKLSAPLIGSIFVSGSAEYIDGLIVKSKFDDMFFAVYRYGAKELPVLLIVANTFSTAMIPSIAANLEDGLKELKQKSARMMHIFFPLTIILMPLSPYLYKYVFNDSFIYSSLIFNIYLLLAVPRLLFPQTILTGTQKTPLLLLSSVLEIIINVSLSIYLAGIMGLPGIAFGTFIAYLFDKIFLMAVNRFYLGIPVSKYVPLKPYFVYVILTFVSLFCSLQVLKNI